MRDLFRSILKKTIPAGENRTDAAGSGEQELHVATCAVLLEIAHADDEFSAEEEQRIVDLMQKQFQLPEAALHEIKEMSEKKRSESIDLWQFTNTIKEHFSPEQKERVIEMIWHVIYADGNLDQYEDYLVHKLAKLLGLNHKQMIDAKVRVLKQA